MDLSHGLPRIRGTEDQRAGHHPVRPRRRWAGVWVSGVGEVVGWEIACTILRLWRERRTRSTGSIPRAGGGLEMVDYPWLKITL